MDSACTPARSESAGISGLTQLGLHAGGANLFFWTPGAMNGSTKVQSSQANSGCMLSVPRRVRRAAARHAIPTLYEVCEFVEAGGLMSYGTVLSDGYWKGADTVTLYRLDGVELRALRRLQRKPGLAENPAR